MTETDAWRQLQSPQLAIDIVRHARKGDRDIPQHLFWYAPSSRDRESTRVLMSIYLNLREKTPDEQLLRELRVGVFALSLASGSWVTAIKPDANPADEAQNKLTPSSVVAVPDPFTNDIEDHLRSLTPADGVVLFGHNQLQNHPETPDRFLVA